MNKTISLVVLNYNGIHLLKEYFDSLFKQTLLPDEIIMLDNNSSDDSVTFVKKNYPKVKVVVNTSNDGTAGGSNRGFDHVTGDYVIFHSNDLKLDKNNVKALVETIKSNKKIGIVTSVFLKYKPEKNGEYLVDNAGGIVDMFGFGMQKYPAVPFKEIPEIGDVFFSYGSSFIIPTKLYKKLGGFDDRFFTLNDDIDLSWRVRKLGYSIVYAKKSFVYHHGSATLGPLFQRSQKRYWSERNTIATLIKNHTLIMLIVNGSIYMLLLLAEMAYFIYRGKMNLFWADFKAIMWNVKEFPETIKRRIEIQKLTVKNVKLPFERRSIKLSLFNDLKQVL